MRINTNVSALNALNNLQSSDSAMSKSLERLSSGLRINRAADDAAGLAISEKMRNQIKGLNQARRNAQDGVSLIQTAEGALGEVHSILARMRELAIQASNDTLTNEDKEQVQKEINLLIDEVDRISTDTEFNTKKLLNGDASATAKLGSAFNDYGNVVQSVKATSVAETGTYKIKFNNKAASVDMGTITRSSAIEGDYMMNSSDVANINDAGFALTNLYSSTLTATGTGYYDSAVKPGTFFINGKEIRIENNETMYSLMNKINNSGSGVGATVVTSGANAGQLVLLAGKDVASNIKLEAGTSDFLTVAGFSPSTSGWTPSSGGGDAILGFSKDDQYLTGATGGSVRLVNLQAQGGAYIADADPTNDYDGTSGGLLASDVITISGKVGGQIKTNTMTVGTSSVNDLLHTIENTFGAVEAKMERQRATNPASIVTDFDETKTLAELWPAAGLTAGNVDFRVNGVPITYNAGDPVQVFLDKVNAEVEKTGVSASLDRDNGTIVFGSANNLTMIMEDGSGNIASILGLTTTTNDVNKITVRGKAGSGNAVTDISISATDSTGVTQRSMFNSLTTFQQMQVARDKGDFVGVAQLNTVPDDKVRQEFAVAVKPESVNSELINGVSISIGKTIDEGTGVRDVSTVTVGQFDGSVTLQIGANKGQITTVDIGDMSSVALGLKSSEGTKIFLGTRHDAQNALDKIDKAIQLVSLQRSELGAFQNRLEHTITSLGVSSENLTASESRIRDLDMAKEMAEFTRSQILMQAGTAMAAQANQKPQSVMKLLG